MNSGTSKKTLLLCFLFVVLAYSEQAAANDYKTQIIECAKKTDVMKRLVCFDAIATQINALDEQALVQNAKRLSSSQDTAAPEQSAPPSLKKLPDEPSVSPVAKVVGKAEVATQIETPPMLNNKPSPAPMSDKQAQIDRFGLPEVNENDTVLIDGELNSVIVEVQKRNRRNTRFVLANGQIWEKVDSSRVELPDANDKVVLRSGALGSFYLRKADRNRSFKVKRIGN